LIDTAGITRAGSHPNDESHGDMKSSFRAIQRSHACVLVVDPLPGMEAGVTQAPSRWDFRVARMVLEEGKILVLAINKWDLVPDMDQERYREELLKNVTEQLPEVRDLPVIFVSAKHAQNVANVMVKVMQLYKRWNARIPTGKLNDWMRAFMLHWPPPWKDGQKCYPKYITQVNNRPPTFAMWTNLYGEMPPNYLRHIANTMRTEFNIQGIPVRLKLRTTLMPKPGKKLTKKEVRQWKRMGPKQAEAMAKLGKRRIYRRSKVGGDRAPSLEDQEKLAREVTFNG